MQRAIQLLTTGDIDVEMPYLDARIFNARAESASYVDGSLSSVTRSVVFLIICTLSFSPFEAQCHHMVALQIFSIIES